MCGHLLDDEGAHCAYSLHGLHVFHFYGHMTFYAYAHDPCGVRGDDQHAYDFYDHSAFRHLYDRGPYERS